MSTFKAKFVGADAILKEAKLTGTAGVRWDTRVQVLALSILYHVLTTGDWTVAVTARNLITQSNGVNKGGLTDYLQAFMHGTFSDEDTFVYDANASASDIDMDQAIAVHWSAFKKTQPKAPAKSLGELLAAFESGAKKSVKAGKITAAERDLIVGTFEAAISEHNAQEVAEAS